MQLQKHIASSPLQDFTQNSDIDWTKSIPEIDAQLYAKYGLSPVEVEFIEKNVWRQDNESVRDPPTGWERGHGGHER